MKPYFALFVAALTAVVLGCLASGILWWVMMTFRFGYVSLPFLAFNPQGLLCVAALHLLLRVLPHGGYRIHAWYYKQPGVSVGITLLIVLLAVILPDYGERNWVQVLVVVFGKPALFWLAMCAGDEEMPPLPAAALTSCIGLIHALLGIGMLLYLRGDTIWVFDYPLQIAYNCALISFFDPLYVLVPFALFQFGVYQPIYEEEDDGFSLPVATE